MTETQQVNRLAPQYGYAETGTKLHLGFAIDGPRCIQGPAIVNVVAIGEQRDNRPEMFATLRSAGIRPSALCGHCFPIAVRKAYAQSTGGTR